MRAAVLTLVVGIYCCRAKYPNAERRASSHVRHVGIWGGHSVPIEMAPYMGSLQFTKNGTLFHKCGASIIHKQFLLTAAHCIKPNLEYKVMVGTDDINGKGGEIIDVKQINIHPNHNGTTGDYDFCLIELKRPIIFTSKIDKINIPETDEDLPLGTKFNVSGWGLTEYRSKPRKLRQVEIQLDDWLTCKEQYKKVIAKHKKKYIITPRMICAGDRRHDACQGDSGGPLTLDNLQIGVVSWGFDCGIMPGVYARVSSVRSWILETIKVQKTYNFGFIYIS